MSRLRSPNRDKAFEIYKEAENKLTYDLNLDKLYDYNYKETMYRLNLRPVEQAKITCAKKLFNEISTTNIKYHDVDR